MTCTCRCTPCDACTAHDPIPAAIIGGKVYHKPKGRPYAHGCNRESIRDASRSRADYEGFDLDLRISWNGTAWVCHQANPTKRDAWFDPKGKINDSHPIAKLRDHEVRRLRVRYQGRNRPILTARQAAIFCKEVRPRTLIPCFEAKGMDKRFEDPEWWERFRLWVPRGTHPIIMSLPGARGVGLRKLAAAHEVGLPTMWLWRGTPPRGYAKHVDLVKSRPGRGIYRV